MNRSSGRWLPAYPGQEVLDILVAWRSQPVQGRFLVFTDQIRELAQRLNKSEVAVEVNTGGLRLPTERFAGFFGSFAHVVRNAMDHGLETPGERAHADKEDMPTIVLSARLTESQVVIEISDNGRGIDSAKLRRRAAEKGLPVSTHEDLVNALFADGVSTTDDVTDLSVRGWVWQLYTRSAKSFWVRSSSTACSGWAQRSSFAFPGKFCLLDPGPCRRCQRK